MAGARQKKIILSLAFATSLGWTALVITTPYRRWLDERFEGPPFITSSSSVSPFLANSATITRIINPNNQPCLADTRTVTFNNLRDRRSGKVLSDAEILKRLCIGFWGGSIFSYEKTLLSTFKKDRVLLGDNEIAPRTGVDRADMFSTFRPGRMDFILNRGDTLCRAFQVLDIKVNTGDIDTASISRNPGAPPQPSSYIDFGFGSSQPGSKFAGVHRFSVTRLPSEKIEGSTWSDQLRQEWMEESGGRVMITHESYVCSPSPGGNWMLTNSLLRRFHEQYAFCLFSSGVSYVVRGWGRSKDS